ncbi:MAG: hypothetical protein IPK01_08365 [Acidobacteria bacterium]|nr:hypothetical protein [Acidobacteriota bacterium]
MKILLYNPDNGITRNFMPHPWMFLLQSLTPPEHAASRIDGNAKAVTRPALVQVCKDKDIGLIVIGAMTTNGRTCVPRRRRTPRSRI